MMQFEMTTDLATAIPKELVFNFEELKRELAERLEYYNGITVTEDTIKEGKSDLASLRKLRTAIETRRKDIKAAYLQPYNAFEAKCKELTLLIDEPIQAIDGQLKSFEAARKEKKRGEVAELYEATIKDEYKEIIPLDRIFDDKWLNATTPASAIKADLERWNTRVEIDLLALNAIEPEYELAVRQKYVETLNAAAAVAHRDALRAAKDAFGATEAQGTKEPEKRAVAPEIAPETPPQPTPSKDYSLRLEFRLTREQAIALKAFLDNTQIKYRKI